MCKINYVYYIRLFYLYISLQKVEFILLYSKYSKINLVLTSRIEFQDKFPEMHYLFTVITFFPSKIK